MSETETQELTTRYFEPKDKGVDETFARYVDGAHAAGLICGA